MSQSKSKRQSRESFPFRKYLSSSDEVKSLVNTDAPNRSIDSFDKNIRVDKNSTVYNAHSYHTKVPPEGILPYLQHYTRPGDTILDPFCGSGMTGVAARMFSDSANSKLNVILNDLGPAACHIAYNHTNSVSPTALRKTFDHIMKTLARVEDDLFTTWHAVSNAKYAQHISNSQIQKAAIPLRGKQSGTTSVKTHGHAVELQKARIIYTLWSEAYRCPKETSGRECGEEIVLWNETSKDSGTVSKSFKCPKCRTEYTRRSIHATPYSLPVQVCYEVKNEATGKVVRHTRSPLRFDLELLEDIATRRLTKWYPKQSIAPQREMMTMGPAKLGIKKVSDFYTPRNLRTCAEIWDAVQSIPDLRLRQCLSFACTNTFWHATRMRRYNIKGGMRPLTGTLYIPQLSAECNVFEVLRNKIDDLCRYYALDFNRTQAKVALTNSSATELTSVPNASVDYIFTDPPFGGNLYYSDCSVIWEGWLDSFTNEKHEIHFNRIRKPEHGGKTRDEYRTLVYSSFAEMYRVLKPGRWASIVFNNSDDDVLQTFRNAAAAAGFSIEETCFLDKEQKSVKGYMGRSGSQDVTNCDFVFNLRKPTTQKSARPLKSASKPAQTTQSELLRLMQTYLRDLPKKIEREPNVYTNEHRTTPFLHSMIVRQMITSGKSLQRIGLKDIKEICKEHFHEVDGSWYLSTREASAQNRPSKSSGRAA